jgi:hypothetical protein
LEFWRISVGVSVTPPPAIIAGLDPAIPIMWHRSAPLSGVKPRVKPGHDHPVANARWFKRLTRSFSPAGCRFQAASNVISSRNLLEAKVRYRENVPLVVMSVISLAILLVFGASETALHKLPRQDGGCGWSDQIAAAR